MFCVKCGAQNEDDVKFCTVCGARLDEGTVESGMPAAVGFEGGASVAVASDNKNRKIGIIAVAAAALLVIVIVAVLLFGGRGYEATVKKFINAGFVDPDAEAIFDLFPDEMLEYAFDEAGLDEDEIDEFIEDLQEELEDTIERTERLYGDDVELSYEIRSVKDVKGDDLDDLKDDYEEVDVDVSAAKTVKVKLTFEGEEQTQSTDMNIGLIKVGRSWYLDANSMASIF